VPLHDKIVKMLYSYAVYLCKLGSFINLYFV
jgi:hypothetical protein